MDALKLPDPDDRHVLAAAIRAGAQVIVTANLRDFPADALRAWDVEAMSPDEFVRDQIGLDRGTVHAAVQQIADSWRNPAGSVDNVLIAWNVPAWPSASRNCAPASEVERVKGIEPSLSAWERAAVSAASRLLAS